MDIIEALDEQMALDPEVIKYLADKEVATDFYRALCNTTWYKLENLTEEDLVIKRLQGIDKHYWSCTWRFAGGIIAHIRNVNYNTNEDYMTFYCSDGEGAISPLVRECFNRLGWEPADQD